MRNYLRALGAVIWKDLAAELRSRELLSAMLVFALLVLFIFNFALELNVKARLSVTSGVLWVTFVFAGTIGLNRSLAIEKDRGCLDGLLLAPVDRTAIYFGKAVANLLFIWWWLPLCCRCIQHPVQYQLVRPTGAAAGHRAGRGRVCGGGHAAGGNGCADAHAGYPAADLAVPGDLAGAGGCGQGQLGVSCRSCRWRKSSRGSTCCWCMMWCLPPSHSWCLSTLSKNNAEVL